MMSKPLLAGGLCHIFALVFVFSPLGGALVIVNTISTSLRGDLSVLVVSRMHNASSAGCSTLVRYTSSQSYSDSRKCHVARFPVVSVKFKIHQRASSFIRIVN